MLVAALLSLSFGPHEPNPPAWPSATVHTFTPGNDAAVQLEVDAVFSRVGGHDPPCHGQFSSERHAFLFAPGRYNVSVPVGYYTQVLGLGASPDDVTFTSAKGVYSEECDYYYEAGALSNFWRGVENVASEASFAWATGTGMLWAVSQASPLRRVHVRNDLALFQYEPPYGAAGFASGGFMASTRVGGAVRSRRPAPRRPSVGDGYGDVLPGSQQQWFTRSSELDVWVGGLWNMVFVGTRGAPASHCGPPAQIVSVPTAPVVAEKPYLTVSPDGRYSLVIPSVRHDAAGADWRMPSGGGAGAEAGSAADVSDAVVGFESVYLASPSDSAAAINAKLASGLHVVLSPGIYSLDRPLKLGTANQVLLGLGIATLVAAGGQPCVAVGNVDGVRIGGVLLQAGAKPTTALLQWGDGSHAGDASNPSFLHDVYARVGGPSTEPVQVDAMVRIESGNVVGDNLWLWRADHDVGGAVKASRNPVQHGLVVTGDDVTMLGLAVEHTLADLTVWRGERGRTFFYQSELPYDVTQAEYGDQGYAGYRVGETVAEHDAYGVGVYIYFRDFAVDVPAGIVVPPPLVKRVRSPLAVFLNGNGSLGHVINGLGNRTAAGEKPGAQVNYVC